MDVSASAPNTRLQRPSMRLLEVICIALACLLPLAIAVLLRWWAVNAPQWDEWEVSVLVVKMHRHTLMFADLWAQHNEHRMFVPYSLMLLLAKVHGWNIVREELVGVAVVACAQAVLFDLLRRTASGIALAFSFLLASALLYTLTQAGNWMWGFQLAWFLIVLFAIILVWMLTVGRDSLLAFRFAVLVGVLASFTMSSGLLMWPVGLMLIALDRKTHGPNKMVAWIIAAALCVFFYAKGWSHGGLQSDPTYVVGHPFEVLGYLFAYFGGSLAWGEANVLAGSLLVGTVGIALFVGLVFWYVRRAPHHRTDPEPAWIALGSFSLLAGLMTDVGRAAFGMDQALASRYTTYSDLLWIAIVALAARVPYRDLWRTTAVRRATWVGCAVLCALLARSNIAGLAEMRRIREHDVASLIVLKRYPVASAQRLQLLYPDAAIVRRYAAELQDVADGPFRT